MQKKYKYDEFDEYVCMYVSMYVCIGYTMPVCGTYELHEGILQWTQGAEPEDLLPIVNTLGTYSMERLYWVQMQFLLFGFWIKTRHTRAKFLYIHQWIQLKLTGE